MQTRTQPESFIFLKSVHATGKSLGFGSAKATVLKKEF